MGKRRRVCFFFIPKSRRDSHPSASHLGSGKKKAEKKSPQANYLAWKQAQLLSFLPLFLPLWPSRQGKRPVLMHHSGGTAYQRGRVFSNGHRFANRIGVRTWGGKKGKHGGICENPSHADRNRWGAKKNWGVFATKEYLECRRLARGCLRHLMQVFWDMHLGLLLLLLKKCFVRMACSRRELLLLLLGIPWLPLFYFFPDIGLIETSITPP